MITKIKEDLYSITLPLPNNPLKSLNAYVILGKRNLLIDTGFRMEACKRALLTGLRELNISMDNTDIFLTHLHSDHTGLAPEIRGKNTRIYIGEKDLTHMPGKQGSFHWADSDDRFAAEGFPRALLARLEQENPARGYAPIPYDSYIPVTDGDEFSYGTYRLRAIHTPGHTPGHMCLYDEIHGILFSGDHVLFDITPNITRWDGVPDSLGDYLRAIASISTLPVTLPLPAHRAVSMTVSERCRELQAHHQKRCDEVLEVLREGNPMTAWEIAGQMTWRIRAKNWEDFPLPQKWFAVGEALAHLDHLVVLGQVLRTFDGSLFRYTVSDHLVEGS